MLQPFKINNLPEIYNILIIFTKLNLYDKENFLDFSSIASTNLSEFINKRLEDFIYDAKDCDVSNKEKHTDRMYNSNVTIEFLNHTKTIQKDGNHFNLKITLPIQKRLFIEIQNIGSKKSQRITSFDFYILLKTEVYKLFDNSQNLCFLILKQIKKKIFRTQYITNECHDCFQTYIKKYEPGHLEQVKFFGNEKIEKLSTQPEISNFILYHIFNEYYKTNIHNKGMSFKQQKYVMNYLDNWNERFEDLITELNQFINILVLDREEKIIFTTNIDDATISLKMKMDAPEFMFMIRHFHIYWKILLAYEQEIINLLQQTQSYTIQIYFNEEKIIKYNSRNQKTLERQLTNLKILRDKRIMKIILVFDELMADFKLEKLKKIKNIQVIMSTEKYSQLTLKNENVKGICCTAEIFDDLFENLPQIEHLHLKKLWNTDENPVFKIPSTVKNLICQDVDSEVNISNFGSIQPKSDVSFIKKNDTCYERIFIVATETNAAIILRNKMFDYVFISNSFTRSNPGNCIYLQGIFDECEIFSCRIDTILSVKYSIFSIHVFSSLSNKHLHKESPRSRTQKKIFPIGEILKCMKSIEFQNCDVNMQLFDNMIISPLPNQHFSQIIKIKKEQIFFNISINNSIIQLFSPFNISIVKIVEFINCNFERGFALKNQNYIRKLSFKGCIGEIKLGNLLKMNLNETMKDLEITIFTEPNTIPVTMQIENYFNHSNIILNGIFYEILPKNITNAKIVVNGELYKTSSHFDSIISYNRMQPVNPNFE